MKKEFPALVIRLALILSLAAMTVSCGTSRKGEKYYERQEKKRAETEQREYEKLVRQNRKIQSKQTLKMMRQTERESGKLNKSKKRRRNHC